MSAGISASAAVVGGAILGGAYLSSQAAKSAAGTQADAAAPRRRTRPKAAAAEAP